MKKACSSVFPSWRALLVSALASTFLIVAAPGTATAENPEDDGWTDLFNGKNLDGWVNVNCAPETWSVRDGMIHCTGKPIGHIRTERHYENFILELEWRHLTDGGNSGVFLWSSPLPAPGVPFLRGIEVQVLDHGYGQTDRHTTHGDVFPTHGARLEPFPPSRGMRSFPSEERSLGFPEWNHYRIECNDGTIRLHVNGKEVSGGENAIYRKGYISLEAEGAPIDFRNIRIRELPSTNAPPEETAAQAKGHRTLYTGTDLRGWRADGESASAAEEKRQTLGPWQVNDWRLRLTGGSEGNRTLWTAERFGDAEFIVDVNVAAPPEGEEAAAPVVRLRGDNGDSGLTVTLDTPPGQWNRFTLRVNDGRVTVLRGEPGVEVKSLALPAGTPERGSFGLVDVPGAIQFANLFVLERTE